MLLEHRNRSWFCLSGQQGPHGRWCLGWFWSLSRIYPANYEKAHRSLHWEGYLWKGYGEERTKHDNRKVYWARSQGTRHLATKSLGCFTQSKNKKISRKPFSISPKRTYRRPTGTWKMLNITNYYRNAKQNYSEITPDTTQNGYHQKIHKQMERVWRKDHSPTLLVGM